MRILVVNVEIPFPPVGGGRLRTYHLLRALSVRHDITLVGFTFDIEPETPSFPVHVIGVPWELPQLYKDVKSDDETVSKRAYEVLAFGIEEPWFVSYFASAAMRERLSRVARDQYDLILIEDSDMAQFLPCLPPETPKVLDFHNVYSLIALRATEVASGNNPAEARHEADRTLRFEKRVVSQCRLALACSAREAAAVRDLLGVTDVEVVPNGVDTEFFTPTAKSGESHSLLFTGTMSYAPNVEAAQFFTEDILPLIQKKIPTARLHIVGMKPTPVVTSLASESVVVHGGVPDVRPYYQAAEIVVVPILHGGGTRLKVLEAAASGKAIVTTPLGMEGLEFRPGKDVLVAETASDFANAVIVLATDPVRRLELGERARRVSLQYDWEHVGSRFRSIVEAVAV